jgi:hypothetical protein
MDRSLYRNGRTVLAADLAAVETERAAELEVMRANANKAKAYERLSREQICGHRLVKVFGFGWRTVLSVNAVSVTVEEPLAWDGSARYRFDKIMEVKS